MADLNNGLRRRGGDPADAFSDAARFPTLVQDQQNAFAGASSDLAAAAAGGQNSVAGRFNPLDKGSIFSRQFPGAADTARDAMNRADPSNNYYNGPALEPRSTGPQELSAGDRYAIDTGYQSADSIKSQQGLGAISRYAIDTGNKPAMPEPVTPLRKRQPVSDFSVS